MLHVSPLSPDRVCAIFESGTFMLYACHYSGTYSVGMNALGLLPAIRSLRRRPAFTLAAILRIALGVGANIAVFNVIYGVLLQPLPFRDPAKLVALWESTPALPQLQDRKSTRLNS